MCGVCGVMTQDFVIKPINLWANYPSCTTGMSGLGTEQQAQYVNIFFLISPAAEASASACAGVRFIIRKRSYRAWGIRIYKSFKYCIGQSLFRNYKSSARSVRSIWTDTVSLALPAAGPWYIIYHFFLSLLLNDKFNSLFRIWLFLVLLLCFIVVPSRS